MNGSKLQVLCLAQDRNGQAPKINVMNGSKLQVEKGLATFGIDKVALNLFL